MNRVREFRKALGMTQGALGCSVSEAFPDAAPSKILLAQELAETLSDSERLAAGNCRWCGRRNVKAELAVLAIAGEKVYETGHLRCLAEYIVENTDSRGNWKKHRNKGI